MILAIAIFFGGLALVELLWFAGMWITQRPYDRGYLAGQVDATLDAYDRGYQDCAEDLAGQRTQ